MKMSENSNHPIIQELLRRLIQSDPAHTPEIRSPFATGGPGRKGGSDPHVGLDVVLHNQGEVNGGHPILTSPVDGKIVGFYPSVGGIVIKGLNPVTGKFQRLELLHSQTQFFNTTNLPIDVKQGQPVGTMGGVGAPNGAVHLHFQVVGLNKRHRQHASRFLRACLIFVSISIVCQSYAEADSRRTSARNIGAAQQGPACPSQEFKTFFDAFSRDPLIQQRFTHLPLVYGKVEMLWPGDPFEKRKIRAFGAIPTLNSKDGGAIFPSDKVRAALDFDVAMKDGTDEDFGLSTEQKSDVGVNARGVIVLLHIPDTGVHYYYRFRKRMNCWFLVEIDDKST
jgi:hypothetical protein